MPQLLLLQLLRVPVWLIKKASKALAVCTYIPNYFLLLLIDKVLFNQPQSLLLYVTLWIPKLLLLLLTFILFPLHFYGIYALLDLGPFSLLTVIFCLVVSIVALLALMRQGYLYLIANFHLTKLKSVKEHLALIFDFIKDIYTAALSLINILLVIKAKQTFKYDYHPTQRKFKQHITRLIRISFIELYIGFTLKTFFRVFPWRIELILKYLLKQTQCQEKNQKIKFHQLFSNINYDKIRILNIFTLLTLTMGSTLIDIIVMVLVLPLCFIYPPCIILSQYKTLFKLFQQDPCRWRPTCKFFVKIFDKIIVLSLVPFGLLLRPIFAIKLFNKIISDSLFQTNFWIQLLKLYLVGLVQIAGIFAKITIYLTRYKYKRYIALGLLTKQDEYYPKKTLIAFKLFTKIFVQIPAWVLIFCTIIMKPYDLIFLNSILDEQSNVRISLVKSLFKNTFFDFFYILSTGLLSAILFPFDHKKVLDILKHPPPSPFALRAAGYSQEIIMNSPRKWKQFSVSLFTYLITHIHSLPGMIVLNVSCFSLMQPNLSLTTAPQFLNSLATMYYLQRVKNSEYFPFYKSMYDRSVAGGLLQETDMKTLFWKYAGYSDRHRKFQRFAAKFISADEMKKIEASIAPVIAFTELSNYYWQMKNKTNAILQHFLFVIIVTVLSVLSLLLLPLTLWRFPTFAFVYWHHKDKYLFMSIFKICCRELVRDVMRLPIRIIAFCIAPIIYMKFIKQTSFKYGLDGYNTFQKSQTDKIKFVTQFIVNSRMKLLKIIFQKIIIKVLWLREQEIKKSLIQLNCQSIKNIWSNCSIVPSPFKQIQIPPSLIVLQLAYKKVFQQTIMDIPYVLAALTVLLLMPWRIYYVRKCFFGMRDSKQNRSQAKVLLKHLFKDYLCIILSTVLLFSGFKTAKAFSLIRKNFKLNFFVGFLKYSYLKELIAQCRELVFMWSDCLLFIVVLLCGWTKGDQIINSVYKLWKKRKEIEETQRINASMHDHTVETGKELQVLTKMGFNCYVVMTQFLQVNEVVRLERVSKFNYLMGDKPQIWNKKWEKILQSPQNQALTQIIKSNADEREKCISAYQKSQKFTQIESKYYHDLLIQLFDKHVIQGNINIKQFLNQVLSIQTYRKLVFDYRFSIEQGYGPNNGLNEEEEQMLLAAANPQFQRLHKVQMNEYQMYRNWLMFKPVEIFLSYIGESFQNDNNRKKKQLIFSGEIIGFVGSYICHYYFFYNFIFQLDSLIACKIIAYAWFHLFAYICCCRCIALYRTRWIALNPFDLKDDCLYLLREIRNKYSLFKEQLYIKCIVPICNVLNAAKNKTYSAKQYIQIKMTIIFNAIKKKILKVYYYTINKIVICCIFIKRKAIVTFNFCKQKANLFFTQVVSPLYIVISNKIRQINKLLKNIFVKAFSSIKRFFSHFGSLITKVFKKILDIGRNINRTYFAILQWSVTFLLPMGIIGNLICTVFGLFLMGLPSIACYFLSNQRWAIISSTLFTITLVVKGFKHLQNIKKNNQK